MTTFQTQHAKARVAAPHPAESGVTCKQVVTYVFDAAYTTGSDVIEMMRLPPNCRVTDAILIPENLTAGTTADIGFMSGTPGDDVAVRTVGNELWNDVAAVSTVARLASAGGLTQAPASNERAIGIALSANEAANASKKLTLQVEYIASPE